MKYPAGFVPAGFPIVIIDVRSEISAYKEQAIKDIQQMEVDLYEPILTKAKHAI